MLKIIREFSESQGAIVYEAGTGRYFCFSGQDWQGECYTAVECNREGIIIHGSELYSIVPVLWRQYKDESDKTTETLCYEFGRGVIYALVDIEAYANLVKLDDEEGDDYEESDGGVYDNEEELNEFKAEFLSKHQDALIQWSMVYDNGEKVVTIEECRIEGSGGASLLC